MVMVWAAQKVCESFFLFVWFFLSPDFKPFAPVLPQIFLFITLEV